MCFKYLFLYSLNWFFLEEMPYIYISELLTGRLEKKKTKLNSGRRWQNSKTSQRATQDYTLRARLRLFMFIFI